MNLSHVASYFILFIFGVLEKKLVLPSFPFFLVYKNYVLFSSFYFFLFEMQALVALDPFNHFIKFVVP